MVATAALALGISGVATAATTVSSGGTVTFTAAPGEFNNVLVGYDAVSTGGPYIVTQDTNRSSVNNTATDASCTNANPNNSTSDGSTVWCPAAGVTKVVVNGGDQNDSINPGIPFYFTGGGSASPFFPSSVGFLFDGGDGNDSVTLPTGTTTPGTGPSGTAFGGNGNDTVGVADGQTANGGPGDDTLFSFGPFSGEKQPFGGATENGDAGQDQLNGSGAVTSDHLNGGDDNDVIFPGAGPEDLTGGNGIDTASWTNGGGPGNGVNVSLDNVANDGSSGQGANNHSDIENLLGTGGNNTDVLSGAPGVANFIDGFGGDDTFNVASNPADPDVVVCGDGFVTINADALDTFDTSGPTGCRGRINRPPTGPVGPTLKITKGSAKLDSDGRITFVVGCRGQVRCRGILEANAGSSAIGTADFVVQSGKSVKVDILPRPSYAKRLKKGKSIKSTVTADATDNGSVPSTVTRNVTIKGKSGKKHGKKK